MPAHVRATQTSEVLEITIEVPLRQLALYQLPILLTDSEHRDSHPVDSLQLGKKTSRWDRCPHKENHEYDCNRDNREVEIWDSRRDVSVWS